MAFRAVLRLLVAIGALAANPFVHAQQVNKEDAAEQAVRALSPPSRGPGHAVGLECQVTRGDADVGYSIVEVQLAGAKVTPQALEALVKQLAELPHLRRLVIASKAIQDDDLRLLAGLPRLKSLSLNCNLTGAGVAHLANLQELTSLGFFCSPELTDTALLHMKAMPQLKQVQFVATRNVTDTGLKLLRDLPALEELTLKYMGGISVEGLDVLKGYPALRRLSLVGKIGDGLKSKQLETLRANLPECDITTK